jgi:hypothetical protein
MPAARGRTAPQPRAAAGRPAAAAPESPAGRGRRMDNPTSLADAAAEVEAVEGETARKEAALLRAATAASLSNSAPPATATKNSNDGGDAAVANCEIREPSGRVIHNANAKALEAAARTEADLQGYSCCHEKERIQGELDKMKARLKAAEQGSGGRKPSNKLRLSNGARRVKGKVLWSTYWL